VRLTSDTKISVNEKIFHFYDYLIIILVSDVNLTKQDTVPASRLLPLLEAQAVQTIDVDALSDVIENAHPIDLDLSAPAEVIDI
jgi:hypothetical protein